MNQNSIFIKKLALSGLLVALGVILSGFHIPIGASKCFPSQHFINILGAVLLGPVYSVCVAFSISLLRVSMGLGSLLAFPGSMIGALLASLAYHHLKNFKWACLAEVIGTGIIGGIIATPYAALLMGLDVGAFFFLIPFLLSTGVGSLIAYVLLETTPLLNYVNKVMRTSS